MSLLPIGDVENGTCGSGAPDHEEADLAGAEGVRTAGPLLARRRPPCLRAAAKAAERQGRGIPYPRRFRIEPTCYFLLSLKNSRVSAEDDTQRPAYTAAWQPKEKRMLKLQLTVCRS